MKTLQTVYRFSLQPCARSASNRVAGNNQLQPLQFDGLELLSGMLKIDVFVIDRTVQLQSNFQE